MPIEVNVPIEVFDQEQFHALDRRVMRIVFDVHNEFGRLLDEELYQREIAARCAAADLRPAQCEVRIRVSQSDFTKDYSMDLLLSRGYMMELLEDWGAFLDVNLYREALVHFLGGAASVCKPIDVFSGARQVGTQNLNLLAEDTAFALTTRQVSAGAMREHLNRLLGHTHLRCIQWINLNRHQVEFTTLRRDRA